MKLLIDTYICVNYPFFLSLLTNIFYQMLKNNYSNYYPEVGCDEAGRGCLSGPVVAAAVILPKNFKSELLDDSKKLTPKKRNILRKKIEDEALTYGVAFVSHKRIDEINILNASIEAMHKAIDKMEVVPKHIIVDGNRFKAYKDINHDTIIKGDGKYLSIAAASILAKTYRDEYMVNLHEELPHYNWEQNKGYPTKEHREAISKHGTTPYHRKTFKLLT